MDLEIQQAVERAKDFIHTAIRFAVPSGMGHGPTNVYAPFARDLERYRVLDALQTSLVRLQKASIGHLIPEVQSNLGYALPFAETRAHVAAFPGRLVRLGETIVSVRGPAFGASRHMASIILTTMRHDPRYRSAMNLRFSESRVRQCQALGWRVRAFDRTHEPDDVKKREGGSLEWGTEMVLSAGTKIPDVIYDRGDIGKEPMIRVLGQTPHEVVDKVLQL
jgi:hydroxymethylpyrimidine/phosphomethylpyrimidine kinase